MGFIKIDRKIVNSAIWDDGEPFDKAHAWIDLLLYVNFKESERIVRNKIVRVKRGSQFVSDKFLANRWHWSRSRVRRYIEMLENAKMITVNRTADGTYINVVNYGKFQDWRTPDETADDTTGDTSGETQSKKGKNVISHSKNARARKRASQPPERTYDMDELELKLLATNRNV